MDKNEQIQDLHNPSRLEQFSLDFEYDKTLQQLKREVRIRTLNDRKA